ncbi:MAG: hypothetical protein MHM6MM_006403 [Cercozoa sp. M6MM]
MWLSRVSTVCTALLIACAIACALHGLSHRVPDSNGGFEDTSVLDWSHPCVRRQLIRRRSGGSVEKRRLAILGAGPIGLATALAFLSKVPRAEVTVFEKREWLSRDTWLDLYGEPWYETLSLLREWEVLERSNDTHDTSDGPEVHMMRTKVLQSRLLQQVLKRGGTLIHKTVGADDVGDWARLHQFDLLVVADGSNSDLRSALGFETVMSPHSQKALTVDFATVDGTYSCGSRRRQNRAELSLSPWSFGAVLGHKFGIHSVFERFFEPTNHCQIQIFFRADVTLDDFMSAEAVNMVRKLLNGPDTSIIRSRVVPVEIVSARTYLRSVDGLPVLLLGDAATSAHFRLGFGVNGGIGAMRQIVDHIGSINADNGGFDMSGVNDLATRIFSVNARVQDAIIRAEAELDQLVFFDRHDPSFAQSLRFYERPVIKLADSDECRRFRLHDRNRFIHRDSIHVPQDAVNAFECIADFIY